MTTRFDIITLFPEMFTAISESGITGRALKSGLASLSFHNPRDYAQSKTGRVDDKPYGGGPGMVMQVQPLRAAIQVARQAVQDRAPVIYLSPQGKRLTQAHCEALSRAPRLILLAGRYEGIDQRLIDHDVDEELSVGDYVLTGGELPAMVLIDAVIRLIPGALGNDQSACADSFQHGLLDHPHYTRPEIIDGQKVPEVLLTGDHASIERWRQQQRVLQTQKKRPDIWAEYEQTES
jgi:tRNA (guanine37-N1)-methyltransferase